MRTCAGLKERMGERKTEFEFENMRERERDFEKKD